jgi:hypothetical protein
LILAPKSVENRSHHHPKESTNINNKIVLEIWTFNIPDLNPFCKEKMSLSETLWR